MAEWLWSLVTKLEYPSSITKGGQFSILVLSYLISYLCSVAVWGLKFVGGMTLAVLIASAKNLEQGEHLTIQLLWATVY